MADHVKVIVYVRAEDARTLRAEGVKDIPTWVRDIVKRRIEAVKMDANADEHGEVMGR